MNYADIREGQYFYAPHRRSWGVWKAGKMSEKTGVRMDDFVSDFSTKIQAQNFCYKMNGYTLKKEE